MKAVVPLRAASVLTLFHAFMHTAGNLLKPQPGPQLAAVTAMQQNAFPALGAVRTYWEFYTGLVLIVSLFLTVEGVVFWQLATLAKRGVTGLRPVCATFAVAYAVAALISWRFFFTLPVAVEVAIAMCLGAAVVLLGDAAV